MTVDVPPQLLNTLEQLGYAGHDGLVTGSSDLDAGPRDYVWHDLQTKVGLDAAFFSDGVPLIGFTTEESPQGLAGIRRRLWNYGSVPVLISAGEDQTRAYNAVSYSNRQAAAEAAGESRTPGFRQAVASQLAQAFSRADVESGAFAAIYSAAYRGSERVDAALLNNLQYLRARSSEKGTPQRAAVDALIGGSLTATYLDQRDILTADYLTNITGYANIYEVLESGTAASGRLFEGLAEHFNGDVFGPLPELISNIDESVFPQVSSLLQGDDLLTGQMSLWPYDFRVLPADLVSSIYEQLLEETRQVDSAYYTPRFLVNMLLDETIPWDAEALPKIIDLACGSGAFMTEAFSRLCYRERRRAGRDLSYDELQGILRQCIYGIDINPVAARTAVFGLYMGLLEQLDPPTIWESAVLPKLLGSNVIAADAFDSHALSDQRFDVVLGNPPWRSSLTKSAKDFIKQENVPVADKQIASAFLWLGSRMLKPGGTLGLVMPSKPLLHNRSGGAERFRMSVFEKLDVRVLVDLSAIRRQVFRNSEAPAAIIVAHVGHQDTDSGPAPGLNEILYVAAHPRPLSGTVDALTIAPEEVRGISRKQAESRPEIWSTLLWGNARDIEILDRMRISFPKLREIAGQRDWKSGQGYQVGGGDENDASHMHGLPIIPTSAVHPLRVAKAHRESFDLTVVHRPRDPDLYTAPHVLIRRTVANDRIAAALVEEDAVFPNGVIGISGSQQDAALLATVAAVLSSSVGCYWQFMTSASWGTERDFVELGEHLSLPMPIPTDELAKDLLGLARSINSNKNDRPLPSEELDSMIFKLYGLDQDERDRIRNFMSYDLPRFSSARRRQLYFEPSTDEWLRAYANTVSDALQRTILGVTVSSTASRRGNYCTVALTINSSDSNGLLRRDPPGSFTVVRDAVIVDADQIVHNLRESSGRNSTGIFALPAGFFVREDTVYIVKTTDKDRWSRDAALDDADRIFAALAFGA